MHKRPNSGFVQIIIILVIILAIVGVAIAGYFYSQSSPKDSQKTTPNKTQSQTQTSPTPDMAADWKTYTNATYGYSFQYPSDYIINTYDDSYVGSYLCSTGYENDCPFPQGMFTVTLRENKSHLSPQDWYDSFNNDPKEKETSSEGCFLKDPRTEKNITTFEGHPAIMVSYTLDEISAKGVCADQLRFYGNGESKDLFNKDLFIFDNSDVFLLSTYSTYVETTAKKDYPELDQILSTFKFTN